MQSGRKNTGIRADHEGIPPQGPPKVRRQKVFIPATSINNLFDTYVDNLILNKSLGKNDENINDINNKLSILFGNKILSYDIITNNSYSDIKQIIDFLFS